MKRNGSIKIASIAGYFIFIGASFLFAFDPGREIGHNFISFSVDMLKLLPCAFILIGLFEVWVKRQTIEKHFGEKSGIKGHIWALLLGGTTVGGLYVAFPLASSLYRKGAKLSVILTYIGASGICRVPMAAFEVSFMGLKFTMIRLLVSMPLLVVSSIALGNYLTKRNYTAEFEKK